MLYIISSFSRSFFFFNQTLANRKLADICRICVNRTFLKESSYFFFPAINQVYLPLNVSGQDLFSKQNGGTLLGVSKAGKVAVLLNIFGNYDTTRRGRG